MRVLFSWIGFKDLNYIGMHLKDGQFEQSLAKAKEKRPTVSKSSDYSPIDSIVEKAGRDNKPFERMILFFDLNDRDLSNGVRQYFSGTVQQVDVVDVESQDMHSYDKVWSSTIEQWHRVHRDLGKTIEPYFNLSSGTTSMNALFIVLGKTVYPDKARFIQVSHAGDVNGEFEINFDLGSYAVNEAFRQIDLSEINLSEFKSIIGDSPQIMRAKTRAKKAAATDCNILIYGESGTGKELFASAIHRASKRKDKKFRSINCAAIPPSLLESELFGYKAQAFTGAMKDKSGIFEECDGGTLFLDELEACTLEMQAKLLRVLEPPECSLTCRKFTRVGDTREMEADVRVIGATNERLDENGKFRSDLLNRIATLTIFLPALRERSEDLQLLIEKLFEKIKTILGDSFKDKRLSKSAIKFIESRVWLGNVRELKNALTQAIVFSDRDEITEDDFDPNLPTRESVGCPADAVGGSVNSQEIDLSQAVKLEDLAQKADLDFKKKYIDAARKKCRTKKAAAELLGISYQTMGNWEKAWQEAQKKDGSSEE